MKKAAQQCARLLLISATFNYSSASAGLPGMKATDTGAASDSAVPTEARFQLDLVVIR